MQTYPPRVTPPAAALEVEDALDLAAEEEAWYHHDPDSETLAAVHVWIRQRRCRCTLWGNSLGDEEDAWVRT